MVQSQASKPVDPFHGRSILSLHPRTFKDSKLSLKSNDLEAIHQHMSAMVLQNPDKHSEEAKSVIDSVSEFLNTNENSEDNMKENENPQKNRPALARKRAKFSMKPDTSQSSTILEPTFQMDQLHDPADFFAAYEKFENTRKELKKQRGEDPNESRIPTTARQRRPEMPRRKTSYQHHVYSSRPENDALSSQKALQDTVESQPIHDSQHEAVTPNSQPKEKEVAGSVTKAEDRVNKLYDDLMSSNIAGLDGNEALSYLQNRLNIKPVSINNLQLPNFHDIPTVNLFSSVNSIKDQNILPDTRALSDNLNEITPAKQKLPDQPFNPLSSSPTPPKSPFFAISTFGKLMSKSIEKSVDPFSSRDIDLFPPTKTSEVVSGPATHVSKDKEFSVSANKENLSELLIGIEDREQHDNVEEMDDDIHGNAEDMVEKPASPTKLNLNVEDVTDNLHCEQDKGENENIEDATEKVVPTCPPEENVEITTAQESESHCFRSVQTDDTSFNVPDASLPVQNPDIVPEQQNEEPPKTSMNKRKKTRASKIDTKKKRHSLAGGGSAWTAGVRRSNRIKTKPLEYWRGERLLYARVHNSLPTVIGVKYITPTESNSNGKPGFKVESFVADEYKDLVDLISLH
ncbi:putative centromere protein C/Mif2/cnp3 [Helianthus annuus]|nr:putative centromere protein C/Mif2/cnp3 [Helianthus annuus]